MKTSDILNQLGFCSQSYSIEILSNRQYNSIYRVIEKKTKQRFVLKVAKLSNNKEREIGVDSLKKEYRLLNILENKNLPTPKPILHTITNKQEFLLLEEIIGTPIDNIYWKLDEESRFKLLLELMEYIKIINSITQEEILKFFPNDVYKLPWEEYLSNKIEFVIKNINKNGIKQWLKSLKRTIHILELNDRPKCLIHNDLGIRSNNILIDKINGELKITGILDFERCRIGDPLEEICRLESELLKSLMIQNYKGRDITDLSEREFDLVRLYDQEANLEIIDWYRKYSYILPSRWYLHNYSKG